MQEARRASDGLLRALVRALIQVQAQGMAAVEINFEVRRFFDHVDRRAWAAIGELVGYPAGCLSVCLSAYAGAQRLVYDRGLVFQEIRARGGIPVGSPHAKF